MRKSIYLSIIFVLLVNLLHAQKDEETKKLLKSVADKAMAYNSMMVNFEYTIENVQDKTTEKYTGDLLIKGKKFKMRVDETTTYCDGKNRWVYLKSSNEVNVSALIDDAELEPEERFMNNPVSLYTIYEKGFKYKLSGEENLDGKLYKLVDLAPEDIDKPYFKIRCWISDANDLYALKYFQKDGTRIMLKFTAVEVNKKMKDSEFEFVVKDYPGVEVIDLRE